MTRTVSYELYFSWLICFKQVIYLYVTDNYIMFTYALVHTDKYVTMNGICPERVDSAKFPGVYIDANLSWRNHVCHSSIHISKGIGILSKWSKQTKYEISLPGIAFYYSIFPTAKYERWGGGGEKIEISGKGIDCYNLQHVLKYVALSEKLPFTSGVIEIMPLCTSSLQLTAFTIHQIKEHIWPTDAPFLS